MRGLTGPTGIEFSGELSDLIKSDVPRLFPGLVNFTSLKVVSSADTILPMFEKVLQEKVSALSRRCAKCHFKLMFYTKWSVTTCHDVCWNACKAAGSAQRTHVFERQIVGIHKCSTHSVRSYIDCS
jgi:hypothetical protein